MANTTTATVLRNDLTHYTVLWNSIYVDTADETLVDISTLTMANAQSGRADVVPTSMVLECLEWSVSMNVAAATDTVTLAFDADTDDDIIILGANTSGEIDFRSEGGVVDPKSTGTTGDILVKRQGTPTAGDAIMIKATFRKKA